MEGHIERTHEGHKTDIITTSKDRGVDCLDLGGYIGYRDKKERWYTTTTQEATDTLATSSEMGVEAGRGDILHDAYASEELMVRFAIDESSEGCSLRLELGLEELIKTYSVVSDRTYMIVN